MTNEQLEFSVFCIESVAEKLGINGNEVYRMLNTEEHILDDYIVSNFEVLHTQSKEYIVDDIIDYLKAKGVIMQANRVLLQRKYARIMEEFSRIMNVPLRSVLDFFYQSELYQEMNEGISDMHCRSDLYLVDELKEEWKKAAK